MTETLNISQWNDVAYVGLFAALIVVAGMVSGVASFYLNARSGWRLDTTVLREIMIGLISAITFPLILSLLSSSLISTSRLSQLDYLRLFCLAVCYTLMVRRLFWDLLTNSQASLHNDGVLSLFDLEILRSVERTAPLHDVLPDLPGDLGAAPQKVALRIRDLLNKGLLGLRVNGDNKSELFVTASGWSGINRTLKNAEIP